MNRRHRANPSFSSSLLDEIYRSIDGEKNKEEEMFVYSKKRTAMKGCDARVTCQRSSKVDEWMSEKKKMSEKVNNGNSYINWSSSSTSDSSSGEFIGHRPKPVRTSVPIRGENLECCEKEKSFGKTKSRAMKIYGDLKKVKQPISPGGRIATFLNSLFTASTPKKAKISSSNETISHNNPKSKSSCPSTCSSASSFSRSCLSNSNSSREKPINGAKRSVRFYPEGVILGEDKNCTLYKNEMRNTVHEEVKNHIMEKNRRVEEAARKLLKDYQKVEYDYFNVRDTRKENVKKVIDDDYDDEDDDAASYDSSDLFELDHLSSIEELPVYETTQMRKNLAIASRLTS